MGYLIINRSDGGVSVRSPIDPAGDHQSEIDHWASKGKNGWTVVSWAYSEADPRPARKDAATNLRAGWEWNQAAKRIVINPARTRPLPPETARP